MSDNDKSADTARPSSFIGIQAVQNGFVIRDLSGGRGGVNEVIRVASSADMLASEMRAWGECHLPTKGCGSEPATDQNPDPRQDTTDKTLARLVNLLNNYDHSFPLALTVLRHGGKVARNGWNGRGMWLHLQRADNRPKMSLPYIYMRTAQGDLVPWVASQTDMLTDDWYGIEQ